MQEPASDYYGDRLMAAVNNRAIDRDALADLAGFATGGRPSANYAHTGVDNATAYAVPRSAYAGGYGGTTVNRETNLVINTRERVNAAELHAAARRADLLSYELPGVG